MLSITGVTYRIGGRTLLDQANAQIAEGSKVGLVGRNGAGKSTLLDLIRGALQPDDGTIEFPRGRRAASADPLAERRPPPGGGGARVLPAGRAGGAPRRAAEIETRLVEIE